MLLIQTMLIAGLLVHRRQRRQAHQGVLKSGEAAELRSSYARIRDLARRLITAQEAERTRIARELHDDVGQQLALLSIELEQLGDSVQSARADVLKRAHDASDRAARNCCERSRSLAPAASTQARADWSGRSHRRPAARTCITTPITIDFSARVRPGFRARSRSACSASPRKACATRSDTARRERFRCSLAPPPTGSC